MRVKQNSPDTNPHKSYTDMTVHDPNLIKAYLQRRRLARAVDLMGLPESDPDILDFGSGNGELAHHVLSEYPSARITLFEPAIKLHDELAANVERHGNSVKIVKSLEELGGKRFPHIFCLSVFEHLPDLERHRAIDELHNVALQDARILVEVPNELYLGAVLKGALRHIRRPKAHDGRIHNIALAALGHPPLERPRSDFDAAGVGLPWHGHHLGFDHRNFEEELRTSGLFEVTGPRFAPLRHLGEKATLDVYFELQPVNKSDD